MSVRSGTDVDRLMADSCRDESVLELADLVRWCDSEESSFEPERWRVDDWLEEDEEAVEPEDDEGWVAWPCLVGARVGEKAWACE